MFGKLKEMASNGALDKVIEKVSPTIKEKLQEAIANIDSGIVSEDDRFTDKVITPIKLAVIASARGATQLVPGFDQKFNIAMLHLRDELIVVDGPSISLIDDFDNKLPEVLKSGFEKTKEVA